MAINYMKGEEVVWESYQGKNYRLFHLIKDLLMVLIITGLIYYMLNMVIPDSSLKITLVLLLIGVGYIIFEQVQLTLVRYVITNERVIIKRGWFNVKLTSISLINILDTKVEQKFTERLIKTGTVYLFTANDSQNSDDNFIQNVPKIANVDNPFERHTMIAEIIKDTKAKKR